MILARHDFYKLIPLETKGVIMNSKRIFSLVLCLLLSFSCVVFAEESAAGDQTGDKADITDLYEDAADELYMYGLFKGGSNGFDLKSNSTKPQAAVMVVRLIGAEDEVDSGSFSHPFTDVPEWASDYAGYLYQKGIDISENSTTFGSGDIKLDKYLVLIIESLGYDGISRSSSEKEIFDYALEIGLLTADEEDQLDNTEFDRGTMVYVARKALNTLIAGTQTTLFKKLDSEGLIEYLPAPDDRTKYGDPQETTPVVQQKAAESTTTSISDTIIAKAKTNLGIRYRSGGKSPSTGFDCSGFVGYVMMKSGVWSSHPGSCDGISSKCKTVSMSNAKPGDIVFFKGTYKTSHKYSHVGIYLGNGKMIHASSSNGISIDSITSGYWAKHYSTIARPSALV
jgi:cell wall-associated NlpC family hydrolase